MRRILAVGVLVFLGFVPGKDGQKFGDWGEPVSLGTVVNSLSYDACPTISKSGLSLYFRSDRPDGHGGFDIYVSHRDSLEDPWEAPVNLGPTINGKYNEYCSAFSLDGYWMVFVSNRPGVGSQDLWISHRKDKWDDFGWETPINLGAPINSTAQENGPCLFNNEATGKTLLYFTSGRPAGLPGFADLNIWVSEGSLEDKNVSFEAPKLVKELSSNYTDYQPTIRKDGLEIIFASNRPGSIPSGSNRYPDLWVSTRESTLDPWSEPENLGTLVNSAAFDFHPTLSWDGTTLIFASERGGAAVGWGDLYMTTRKIRGPKDTLSPLTGSLVGSATIEPINNVCPQSYAKVTTLASGNLSHLGLTKAQFTHCAPFGGPSAYTDGKLTLTAANGDELRATYKYTPTPILLHFEGGTGRFESAEGTAKIDYEVTMMFDKDGNPDVSVPWPWRAILKGSINY
jgi:hypothetical protein